MPAVAISSLSENGWIAKPESKRLVVRTCESIYYQANNQLSGLLDTRLIVTTVRFLVM
jgi:hypothetical protein